jgi:hypothetical protein
MQNSRKPSANTNKDESKFLSNKNLNTTQYKPKEEPAKKDPIPYIKGEV